jgi:Ca2+/Na+ antiporter
MRSESPSLNLPHWAPAHLLPWEKALPGACSSHMHWTEKCATVVALGTLLKKQHKKNISLSVFAVRVTYHGQFLLEIVLNATLVSLIRSIKCLQFTFPWSSTMADWIFPSYWVCVYIYIHIYTHTYIYVCICIYMYMYVCVCVYLMKKKNK